jgi:hypothetical protein
VLEVSDEHAQDIPYFAAIDEEMDNGGREALLHYLLNFDLKKSNLRKIPDTAALTDQKVASLNVNQQWWLDVLKRGELPGCTDGYSCIAQQLHENYVRRTDNVGRRHKSTETELGKFLHELMPELRITRPRNEKNTARPRTYHFPSLKECRQRFEKMMKTSLIWGEQEEWERDMGQGF